MSTQQTGPAQGQPGRDSALPAYEDFMNRFRPEDVAKRLSGNLETGLNVCYECCDRHAQPDRPALFWEGENGHSSVHTFAELSEHSARFANFLQKQGVQPGDRIACLLPRIPELMITALGVWRAGAVYVPLFTAFGSGAIDYRLRQSDARLIVTDTVNRFKLNDLNDLPPVITVSREQDQAIPPGDFDFENELGKQMPIFSPVLQSGDDPFILLFTSGTTGSPKGVSVPLKAILSFIIYMKYGVDLRSEDAFWNVADPGWAYGLYYAVIGPLLLGNATLFYDGPFTPESTYRMISKYGITSLAAAPTAYRMLMAAGDELPRQQQLRLRVACSAGEPLNPATIRWVEKYLECPVYDQYGQTELGMAACNHHGLEHPIHPGSLGMSIPGFRMTALDKNLKEVGAGRSGHFVVDLTESPLCWFQGYWRQETEREHENYYLTGDMVKLGTEGNFFFIGRDDDIILSAGYRIGPFDVESTLNEHPAVTESAVIGKPDPERGQNVVAFVVPAPEYSPSPGLATELQQWVRDRLSSHAYPREIRFVGSLPKTPSGKIQRFLLRQDMVPI